MLLVMVVSALALDFLLGEPRRYHPLVGFGSLASAVERRLNRAGARPWGGRLSGVMAVLCLLLPAVWLAWCVQRVLADKPLWSFVVSVLVLYLCIGWQSLLQHARAIASPLISGDLPAARAAVAMIVSRDSSALDEAGIASAATESVLENGADAVINAIFWFCVAGMPGVLLYRLSNTLDAMWGYKNERFFYFGWAAARLDDVLNYLPARLTALLYALAGNTRQALYCWRTQAGLWKSPNAGVVMSSGAGALNVALGGVAVYHGKTEQRPPLGAGSQAGVQHIQQAMALLNRAIAMLLILMLLLP